MSDALSFAEIDGQHVELLPARTVLSLFSVSGTSSGETSTTSTTGTDTSTTSTPANTGGAGSGKAAFLKNWIYVEGDMTNTLTGGAGGSAGETAAAS